MAHRVKSPPALQETWVQFLGQEATLEKGMVTHSGILTWEIPWTGEPGGLQFMGWQQVRHDWYLLTYFLKFGTLSPGQSFTATRTAVLALSGLPSFALNLLQNFFRMSR